MMRSVRPMIGQNPNLNLIGRFGSDLYNIDSGARKIKMIEFQKSNCFDIEFPRHQKSNFIFAHSNDDFVKCNNLIGFK